MVDEGGDQGQRRGGDVRVGHRAQLRHQDAVGVFC